MSVAVQYLFGAVFVCGLLSGVWTLFTVLAVAVSKRELRSYEPASSVLMVLGVVGYAVPLLGAALLAILGFGFVIGTLDERKWVRARKARRDSK